VRAVNGNVAIAKVGTMDDVLAGRLAQPRTYTVLLGAFAVLALVLATVGLYGVISYSVAQRTRELGIRLALGSSPSALVRGVLREGAVLMAVGIVLGVAGGFAATKGVASLLPSARPGDRLTLASAAALMLVVGAAASYIPARRAARVDPLTALRTD
jgi:ABC-type antimicrobial peptide transport system permease subunit